MISTRGSHPDDARPNPARAAIVFALAWLSIACSSNPTGSPTYVVRRGDTLYAIAERHRLNYKDIARWNGIGRDYVIYPGQVLKLRAAGGRVVSAPQRSAARTGTPLPQSPRAAAVLGPPVKWQWPVAGGQATLTQRPNGGNGLNISGQQGQQVHAAGDGTVVYTGSGLLGYGQLLIIKHNDTYLSAYGHTQALLVHEGEAVRAGTQIATMGNGPQGSPMLYFEIRINGAPGNPLLLLPQR